MNDDVPEIYSAVHHTRDDTQNKPLIQCHCCIFQYDSLSVSTVTEVQGLSSCCAYDMWVTKLLSMEILVRRGREEERGREWLMLPAHYLKLMASVQNERRKLGIVIFI